MFKKTAFLVLVLTIHLAGRVCGQPLSELARISVLNFGPGSEVYAIWGHTAIRVNDPANQIDKVYNYGTFDFDTPNFTLKFIRGKLDYTLSIQRYRNVIAAYRRENRSISEQYLDLTREEANRLYELLEENYKEENRYYKYDFLYDNCATRPVEIIRKSISRPVVFNPGDSVKTYRNILDEHLGHDPWLDFGIDLIIGVRADTRIGPEQQMFMPVYINRYFRTALKDSLNQVPLVREERILSDSPGPERTDLPTPASPFYVLLLLLVAESVRFIYGQRKGKIFLPWWDHLWFILASLGSLVVLFMWFGTDHIPTKNNWNLWWLSPVFFFTLPPFPKRIRIWAAKSGFLILLAFLIFWSWIPQQIHVAVLPLCGMLGLMLFNRGFGFLGRKTSPGFSRQNES